MDTKVGQLFYEITAKYSRDFTTNIKAAETNVKGLGKSMEQTEGKTDSLKDSLGKFAKGIGLAYLTSQIISFGKASVQAFANAQQSVLQYNNAQKNLAGSTKEQIDDLSEYIDLLEKRTTIDDKSIRQAAQILAQDQISIQNQKKLLGGIVDLAVANAKANGSEVDVAGTGKAIGLAFAEGNLGRLVKQNVAGITEAQKKLFEVGTEAQRTAILMKILDENAKGAGEALGTSFQGNINRAKDFIEDLQVAVGSGLNIALANLVDNVSETTDTMEMNETKTKSLGQSFVFLSGLIGFVVNSFKLMGRGIITVATLLTGFAGVVYSFGRDAVGSFGKVGGAIMGLHKAFTALLSGDFGTARETLKNAFDFSGVFNRTIESMKELEASSVAAGDATVSTFNELKKSALSMAESADIYARGKKEQDALTASSDSLAQATKKVRDLTQDEKEAMKASIAEKKKAQEQLDSFNKTLADTVIASKKAADELTGKLSDAFKDFSKSVSGSVQETNEKLAEIIVKAEQRKKELIGKTDRTTEDQKELDAIEKALKARVGFEERSAKQIEDIRSKLSKAGLDPAALQLATGQKTFAQQLDEARANGALDEFSLFEQQQNAKLQRLTDDFITETTLLKSKIDTQKKFEDELTTFLLSENAKRTADIEAFAQAAIKKYGEMAASLRNVISLQAQIGQIRSDATPQFHSGGYVGAAGGQVHAGEYVVPAHLVRTNPDLIGAIDRSRTQNNSITINANQSGGSVGTGIEEMLWRLGKL